MSRYFFEFSNGRPQPDEDGLEYRTLEEAIADGVATLKRIGVEEKDSLSDGSDVRLVIHDADGQPVFAAAISLTSWRLRRPPRR